MLLHRSCSLNVMWVDMLCQLSSCRQFDWLVFGLRLPGWLAADFGGGQKKVASNHLWDLTAFIIDCSWSWSGLPTQADGKHWSAVNSMRLDEPSEVSCCGLWFGWCFLLVFFNSSLQMWHYSFVAVTLNVCIKSLRPYPGRTMLMLML